MAVLRLFPWLPIWFISGLLVSQAANSQTLSTVDSALAINMPVVQAEADFYHVVLAPLEDKWQVVRADSVFSPEFISGRVEGEQLTILCLSFEGAIYEASLKLVDTPDETVLFEVLSVIDITGDTDCTAGVLPDAVGSSSSFDPLLPFSKFEVKEAVEREALCNDGSPAAFYFRPSQTESNNWKIHLQGGGDCSTEEDCQLRASITADTVSGNAQLDFDEVFLPFTSSTEYPDSLDLEGIFSLDLNLNPEFGTYNHVFIPYCSSDSHFGDRNESADTFGFQFKGKKIVDAVIEDLLDSSILGENNLQNSELVVISGTSAGGRGVQQNLDRMAALIPHDNVYGVLDSSYFTRYFLTEEERLGLALRQSTLWNGQYDDSCVNFVGQDSKHLCDRVELISDVVQTAVFIYMDQHDEVAIGSNTDQLDEFAQHTREELQTLCGVYSGQHGYHGSIRSDERFFNATVSGLSFHDVLLNWLTGDGDAIKTVVEQGPSFACD